MVRLLEALLQGMSCTITGVCFNASRIVDLTISRPTIGTMDKWADEVGDDSYQFDRLLPYYQKSAQYTPDNGLFTNSTNGQDPTAWSPTGGPIQLSHSKYADPFDTWAQRAFHQEV